jgi:ApaG protein
MSKIKTRGIGIEVAHWFRQDLSTDVNGSFIHNYHISIVNNTKFTVQLLTREWHVKHLLHGVSEVSGEGVVGQQPVLFPGEKFEYTSGCELISSIGAMKGTFFFVNLETEELFHAPISEFNLVYPPLLN